MDSVRSSSPLFSDSDRLELPSLAQGNLISFDPEEESRNKTSDSQDRVVSNSPGIPCAQTVQENLSQGIQTSPVMEASPVQHIQDVYGSPSCGEDLTQHKIEEKIPFWEKEDKVKPEFSQYSRYPQPTDSTRNSANVEETSVWRPFVVRENNTRDVNPSLCRRGSVNIEGTRLASYRQDTHMTPPQESVRTNRGYGNSVNVSSGTFILCRERFYPSRQGNPVNRSSGTRLGYRRGFDCTGYVVEDPLSDPYVEFEGQGSGGLNGDFVVQGQGPSNNGVRGRNTVERERLINILLVQILRV